MKIKYQAFAPNATQWINFSSAYAFRKWPSEGKGVAFLVKKLDFECFFITDTTWTVQNISKAKDIWTVWSNTSERRRYDPHYAVENKF